MPGEKGTQGLLFSFSQKKPSLKRREIMKKAVTINGLVALLAAMYVYDPSLVEHSRRVAVFSVAVARRMGLEQGRIEQLGRAGLLHDAGKLLVPRELLLESHGPLAPGQFAFVKEHARETWRLLSGYPGEIARIAAAHHERLNGSGYPCGLRGEAIPLESRILTASDVFEAMTSDQRSYQTPLSEAQALGALESGAGTLFERRVVEALKEVVEERETA
jgi:HD-GYP domain-containing protein (c-di-GMP phosphodiesterase class II)